MNINSITCRGIVIHENKLMTLKLKENDDFYCLPGGKLEKRETIENCIKRELKEELGVDARIGKILFINEGLLKKYDKHIIEFFYLIENSEDFLSIDLSKSSHGFEIHEIKWIDINHDTTTNLLPDFILPEIKNISNTESTQLKTLLSK